MTDKKFTAEEIIKALELAIYRYKDATHHVSCIVDINILKNTLDLINHQEAEIKQWQEEANRWQILLCKEIDNKRETKVEAYKEFVKEIHKEISKAYDNNSSVLREHLDKHKEKPDFEFISIIQGKMNTLRGLDDFIDNLLKEMAGEE